MPTANPQPIVLPDNRMTFAAFRKFKPGVLPDVIPYDGAVALTEKLYQIEGQWVFTFRGDVLQRIQFLDLSQLHSRADFQTWLRNAKLVVDDFTRSLGQPSSLGRSTEQYYDINSRDAEKPDGPRHLYLSADWKFPLWATSILCELKSSRADDAPDREYDEDSFEYWNYDFQIDVQVYHSGMPTNPPLIYGKYYIGMPLTAFAERFPALFPHGTAPSGTFVHKESWHALNGEWTYHFDIGKLVNSQYSAYFQNDQVTENSFQACKKAALAIIDEFKRRYGKPTEVESNGEQFKTRTRKENTYFNVETAQWDAVEGMRIRVEFTRFYGGAGYELFTLNVQATDKVFAGN
jgi:hypothetical protein